jgi:hypothetical protein
VLSSYRYVLVTFGCEESVRLVDAQGRVRGWYDFGHRSHKDRPE